MSLASYDQRAIKRDLVDGGFTVSPQITTATARSHAKSPRIPAVALCQGTPLRNEIEARDASRLGEATDTAALPGLADQTFQGRESHSP